MRYLSPALRSASCSYFFHDSGVAQTLWPACRDKPAKPEILHVFAV